MTKKYHKPKVNDKFTLTPCGNCNNTIFILKNDSGTVFQCAYCGITKNIKEDGFVKIGGIRPN